MAKHEIAIHENTGTTKDKAPYLGSYITKGTVGTEGFVSALAAKCGLPTIQVQAILSGCIEAIEALEREELVRIHLDGFTVMGAITGTFDTSDAAFDPERNAFNLVLTPEPEIRNAVIDVQPVIVTDASLTRLRVDNVADLGSPRPYNTVHGQSKFRVAGFNMSLSDEGAGAHFEGEGGAVYPLVVDEVVSKQLFVAHTAALLEAGEYRLVVKSRAGDAEGPLQTAFRKVKYLKVTPAVLPPEIGEIRTESTEDGTVKVGEDVVITGANLAGATVKIKYKTPPEEERQTYVCPAVVAEDGKITIAYENWRFVPDDLESDTTIEFIVETAGGSTSRDGIEVDFDPPAP